MKKIVLLLFLLLLVNSAIAEGSWEQINQVIERPEGWKQIVEDPSVFQLGEKIPYEDSDTIMIGEWGTYPSLDGSTVCVPMAIEFARQWLNISEEDAHGFVNFSTTPNAYDRLTQREANPMVTITSQNVMMDSTHPIDLVLGTAPNEDERNAAREAGIKLQMIPVCYDAFVFIVNGENPVNGLTTDQIVQIYTGEHFEEVWTDDNGYEQIDKWDVPNEFYWSQFGGDDTRIISFQRPHGSGSQTAMEEMVMKDHPLITRKENVVNGGMMALVQRFGEYSNEAGALGYTYLYYLQQLVSDEHVKVLAIDGVDPTEEMIRSGTYPYSVCYYAVFDENNEVAKQFAEWIASEEGQTCVQQAGYISIQ